MKLLSQASGGTDCLKKDGTRGGSAGNLPATPSKCQVPMWAPEAMIVPCQFSPADACGNCSLSAVYQCM